VHEISREPLNGFAPNSHGRRAWSPARTSLKVKGQGHQGQKRHFSRHSTCMCDKKFHVVCAPPSIRS